MIYCRGFYNWKEQENRNCNAALRKKSTALMTYTFKLRALQRKKKLHCCFQQNPTTQTEIPAAPTTTHHKTISIAQTSAKIKQKHFKAANALLSHTHNAICSLCCREWKENTMRNRRHCWQSCVTWDCFITAAGRPCFCCNLLGHHPVNL